jgi:hypothetical protein
LAGGYVALSEKAPQATFSNELGQQQNFAGAALRNRSVCFGGISKSKSASHGDVKFTSSRGFKRDLVSTAMPDISHEGEVIGAEKG